ncbi:MAG: hypothetical protein ACI93R_003209 [Flavobacteriales bacterium]|jgi:hypothetical protein
MSPHAMFNVCRDVVLKHERPGLRWRAFSAVRYSGKVKRDRLFLLTVFHNL